MSNKRNLLQHRVDTMKRLTDMKAPTVVLELQAKLILDAIDKVNKEK